MVKIFENHVAKPTGAEGRAVKQATPRQFPTGARSRVQIQKVQTVRSLLYQNKISRSNMRWKALAEIYNFHILLLFF